MKRFSSIAIAILLIFLPSCRKIEVEGTTDQQKNFEALWNILNDNYCYFEEKNIDWDAVKVKYQSRLDEKKLNTLEFFDLLSDMIRELKDGHCNLISFFDHGKYTWTNPNDEESLDPTLRKIYLGDKYRVSRGMIYKKIKSVSASEEDEADIGYIIYPSFMNSLGEMQFLSLYFVNCKGVIIDVRGNGGGLVTNSDELLSYLLSQKTLVGYTRYKKSAKRGDYSDPRPQYVSPYGNNAFWANIPIVVLQDAGSYSATNDFLYKSVYENNITTVGLKSGGGAGLPSMAELPNGWRVRYSTAAGLDRKSISHEQGIEPEVRISLSGAKDRDDIIEKGIEIIYSKYKV
ncbi:MAG: S41 family peptidase [Porphyromonas sp.]|nr:S41 family peptidase [Porphyromonas sp.]